VRYSDSTIFATVSHPFSNFVIPHYSDSVIL
jgi:hypothetical protein